MHVIRNNTSRNDYFSLKTHFIGWDPLPEHQRPTSRRQKEIQRSLQQGTRSAKWQRVVRDPGLSSCKSGLRPLH